MAFWDSVLSATQAFFAPRVTYLGAGQVQDLLSEVAGWSPAQMYRKQPHLRTVTSFLGRNVAQLGLHFFEPVSDTDRRRDRDNPAARMLANPNPTMTSYQAKFALVVDKALYDVAYWWVVPGRGLYRIPPAWVEQVPTTAFEPSRYRITLADGTRKDIPGDEIVVFGGYDPVDPSKGSPAIASLKQILVEQTEAALYRSQIWKRGGRVSSVIERPANAKEWSDTARETFRQDWYAKYTGNGPMAGGTPILEDGMQLKRIDFNATEQQYVEGVKLGLALVASAYHVNPTMVGLLDNANFSNVREFRKALYGETLGPTMAEIEATINERLLPMLGIENRYCEFNIAEKLQGNFEEQASVMSTSIGAPWMTRNEGRARVNLPRIEGGDDLVTPLNVLIGGQGSPTDSAPDPFGSNGGAGNAASGGSGRSLSAAEVSQKVYLAVVNGVLSVKEARAMIAEAGADIDPADLPEPRAAAPMPKGFRARQLAVISSKVGAGVAWWDGERWDRELVAEGWTPEAAHLVNTELREAIEAELKSHHPVAAIPAALERLSKEG